MVKKAGLPIIFVVLVIVAVASLGIQAGFFDRWSGAKGANTNGQRAMKFVRGYVDAWNSRNSEKLVLMFADGRRGREMADKSQQNLTLPVPDKLTAYLDEKNGRATVMLEHAFGVSEGAVAMGVELEMIAGQYRILNLEPYSARGLALETERLKQYYKPVEEDGIRVAPKDNIIPGAQAPPNGRSLFLFLLIYLVQIIDPKILRTQG